MYNGLDIQCEFYEKCKKVVKLSDLADHEATCQLPKCFNFDVCENHAKSVSHRRERARINYQFYPRNSLLQAAADYQKI